MHAGMPSIPSDMYVFKIYLTTYAVLISTRKGSLFKKKIKFDSIKLKLKTPGSLLSFSATKRLSYICMSVAVCLIVFQLFIEGVN